MEITTLIGIAILGYIFAIIFMISNRRNINKLKNNQEVIETLENDILKNEEIKLDFSYVSGSLAFMDQLIKDKYTFYLYSELMPIYLDNKIPEKSQIRKIKERIYVSVVGGLTIKTKKSLLDAFTEKGIRIYINEKIMILLNKTDFSTSNKYNEVFKNINTRQIDGLIP
jgi:hypothetical protein